MASSELAHAKSTPYYVKGMVLGFICVLDRRSLMAVSAFRADGREWSR